MERRTRAQLTLVTLVDASSVDPQDVSLNSASANNAALVVYDDGAEHCGRRCDSAFYLDGTQTSDAVCGRRLNGASQVGT